MELTHNAPMTRRPGGDGHGPAPEEALQRALTAAQEALRSLAAALDPFPTFAGPGSIRAVEVDPPPGMREDLGCVVVCPDGALYRLVLRMIPGPIDTGGVDQVEELEELDLPPQALLRFTCAALRTLARLLEERHA